MASSSAGEQDPLLGGPSADAQGQTEKSGGVWQWIKTSKDFVVQNPILLATFCVQFLNYFAKHMVEVPMIKLFEQAICNRYYALQGQGGGGGNSSGEIDEQYCKIPAVQNELAAITGLKFTFDALPALLTALYYGSIADRLGRRIVLALCAVGTMLSYLWILFICYARMNLPVKLVWVSSLFLCIGGSQRVAKSMNFTVLADATEAKHRYATLVTANFVFLLC